MFVRQKTSKLFGGVYCKVPNRSVRKQSMVLVISDSCLRRILHFDLNFHPYKIVVLQKLNERDFGSRVMT